MKKKGDSVVVYYARLFPGIFDGDRHNVSLPVWWRRQFKWYYLSLASTRGPVPTICSRIHTQLLHMTNRRLLPFNLFARLHLHTIVFPCRALHTATAVGWHSKYARFFIAWRTIVERWRVAPTRVDKVTIDQALTRIKKIRYKFYKHVMIN